jgi:RNA polymerase sigma factor (sigma-70 family)
MRAIYDTHFALVWRYMAQRGVRQGQIDDLVHRVFRVVREHPGRRETNLEPAVLVCMVARQVLLEFQRNGFGIEPRSNDGDAPTEIFERGAAQELLQGGLELMTDEEREVYLLCEGERMPVEEVSDALGMPESVVQRKRAKANKQMNEFLSKLRKSGVWKSSSSSYENDLLEASQSACTPTERDRGRVFAAMIAHSMTSPLEFAPTEMVPVALPRPMLPPPAPQAVRSATPPARIGPPPLRSQAETATARQPAQSWPPKYARQHKTLMWGAASAIVLTFSLATYFLAHTNASEGPAPESVAMIKPQKLETRPAPASEKKVVRAGALAATPKPSAAKPSAPKPSAPKPQQERSVAPTDEARERSSASVRPAKSRSVAAAVPKETRPEPESAKEKRSDEAASRDAKRAQAAEAKLLFAAERNYRGGAPELALEMVANHERRYPDSALSIERDGLRAQLLCLQGRHREARRVVAELEAENATPAVLDAVERACTKGNK